MKGNRTKRGLCKKMIVTAIGVMMIVGILQPEFILAQEKEKISFIVPAHWRVVQRLKTGERDKVPPRRLWFYESIRDFWEMYPDIKFEMEAVNYQNIPTTFVTRSMAGNPPDIITYDNSFMKPLVESDLLAPLDKFTGPGFWNDHHAQILKNNLSVGEHVYLMPCYISPMTFFYNKKLFKEAGLDPEKPPRTWDEVIEYGKIIQEKTDAAGIGMGASTTYVSAVRPVESLVYSAGANMEKDGYATFETPELKKVLQLYVDLIQKHKIMPEECAGWGKQEWQNNFNTAQIAMTIEGSWYYGNYVRSLGKDAVGYAPIPTFTKDQIPSPWMEIFGWSMSKRCAESNRAWDAWRLIEHLGSRHTLILAAIYQQGLPPRRSLVGDNVYQQSEFLSFASEYISKGGRGRPSIKEETYWEQMLLEAIQSSVLKVKTVDQALSDAQKQYDARARR